MSKPKATDKSGLRSELVRHNNLSAILKLVHIKGPLTRSEIVDQTGLSRNTVGMLVGELTTNELVSEYVVESNGSRGRPSPTVHPAHQTSAVIGVEILVDSLAVAVVGIGGETIKLRHTTRDRNRNHPELVATDLAKSIESIINEIPSKTHIYGIGIAVPGLVEPENNVVLAGPNLGWENVPFGQLLQEKLSASTAISIRNEADLGALAEQRRGAATGINNILFVSADIGIGGGIISDGTLLSGTRGLAGEVGHLPVEQKGRTCRCGAIGCWETVIGSEALIERIGRDQTFTYQTVADSLTDAAQGDNKTLKAYEVHGHWLGVGLAGIISILNPQMIILGGFLGPAYPYVINALHAELNQRVMPAIIKNCEVVPSELRDKAQLQGAAEFAWDHAFATLPQAIDARISASELQTTDR